MIHSKRTILSFTADWVSWKVVASWAEGEEVAAALSEDAFGGEEEF